MALITGIFPSCEPADIETALKNVPNLDAASVKVITKNTLGSPEDASPLNFISVSEGQDDNSLSDDMTRGTGIMSGSGGTSVPGLGSRNARLTDFASRGSALDYLQGFGLPGDLSGNYNAAVSEGRCVVVIPNGDDETAASLRSAGFRNVHCT